MKLKRINEKQPVEEVDCGKKSKGEKPFNSGSSSSPPNSSSLVPKSKRDRANLSHPLQTKLDKLVTKFDQIIFSHEINFTVIESNFGNQLWADKVDNADIFWQCFIGALIRKLGFTEDKAYKDEANLTALDDISYTEVEASWIWWEIKDKIKRSGLELPSVGNFVGYMAKYLDDPKVESTQLENTILVIAIFIHLYPLSQIREMAQLNNGYILTYLMDQIVDKVLSIQAAIYALFALQRILQASVFLSEVPNYENFQKNLKELASFIPDVVCDMELVPKDDAFQAYQASMLAKVTMQKLIELDKFDSLPEIEKEHEHELISLHFKNWFCGTSSGYCNFQMDLPVLDISKQRHLYFEMMYLTTGSIKVGICSNLPECFKKYGVDSCLDMTTCEYTFSFDGYMKECSRDNKDNIKMAVGEIKVGSVVGIRLDSMDRTVTYYIDGEEVKEKKKTNRSKGNSRSWESYPYYVTISLAAMQQATILLTKEEWLMQPNFAHELHELFYDNWHFRMVR